MVDDELSCIRMAAFLRKGGGKMVYLRTNTNYCEIFHQREIVVSMVK